MQEQIDELEYIKSNLTFGSSVSLPSNEIDDNTMDMPTTIDYRTDQNKNRRKRLTFLHEAQRLANERRTSLAHIESLDEHTTDNGSDQTQSSSDDHAQQSSFNFDQRSEDDTDAGNLDDITPGSHCCCL
jgi:hypothetical protein